MSRDNFTQRTKESLGESVGFNCVRSGCARPTMAFNSSSGTNSYLGVAAHDSAAAPGGPRFNADLTGEQRKAIENGAHLCVACARLVDIDPERFPIGTIASWQNKAMECRRLGMHSPNVPVGLDFRTACVGAKNFLGYCEKIWIPNSSKYFKWSSVIAMRELCRISAPMSATNPNCALFPRMVNLQIEALQAIKLVMNEIQNSGNWLFHNEDQLYVLKGKQTLFPSPSEKKENDAIDRSFILVESRINDFFENINKLHSIAIQPYPSIDLCSW